LVDVIAMAAEAIDAATTAYTDAFTPIVREALELPLAEDKVDESLYAMIENNYAEDVEKAISHMAKSERSTELKKVRTKIMEALEAEGKEADKELVSKVLERYKKTVVRAMILDKNIRADGRALDEVRPISIETNLLPSVHGSCLFTRGQTQALVTVTLGDKKDAQMYELITEKNSQSENFMVHYNFPGYSVGEAKYIGAPGRRELGHGNLGKRALEPSLDLNYDGSIRMVSEILESNGSSSMATICGGALALRGAEVNTTALVAGIAMGLVSEGDKYAVLTDIMGLEDHDGDMDFKVAGSKDGITAMQMDIKLGGVSLDVLKEALYQAKEGRSHIIDIMIEAEEKIEFNDGVLPSTDFFHIDPSFIGEIIGQAGKTIREMIEKFEVAIDIDKKDGKVKITGKNKTGVAGAREHIEGIVNTPKVAKIKYEVGDKYPGKVKKIVDFGAFIELPDGTDGLLHISKVSDQRVERVSDVLSEGEEISVEILEFKGNKISLGRA